MNRAKILCLGMMLYAADHEEQFPEELGQIQSYIEDTEDKEYGDYLPADTEFELVYQGPLTEIQDPARTIVIREVESWPGLNGGWCKTYGFADGHSEVHGEDSSNFTAWENERIIAPQ